MLCLRVLPGVIQSCGVINLKANSWLVADRRNFPAGTSWPRGFQWRGRRRFRHPHEQTKFPQGQPTGQLPRVAMLLQMLAPRQTLLHLPTSISDSSCIVPRRRTDQCVCRPGHLQCLVSMSREEYGKACLCMVRYSGSGMLLARASPTPQNVAWGLSGPSYGLQSPDRSHPPPSLRMQD